jgi:hypothetical protein
MIYIKFMRKGAKLKNEVGNMKIVKPISATVTMKRSDGTIEIVDASKFGNMCQELADKISAASQKAGKGVVIAWTFEPAVYEKTAEELAKIAKQVAEIADYDAHTAKMRKAMSY